MLTALLVGVLGANAGASEVFAKYADRVVQVRVLGTSTGSRASIGSGFFVAADGLLVTNFHVVATYVWRPTAYRVEVGQRDDEARAAQVLDVDPVHDLAVLRVDGTAPAHFALSPGEPARGATLYSLGNPRDVGLSIVEGTFNGHVDGQLVEQYHFSGSLNPGVSGGPALDAEGRVVGVNVASMGNQLSFLVPVGDVRALLDRVAAAGGKPVADLVARVQQATLAHQDAVAQELLAGPLPTTALGAWQVPGRWTKRLKEWGGPLNEDDPEDLFAVTGYDLRSNFSTYLRDDELTGAVRMRHRLYEPRGIGALQLYRRAGSSFSRTTTETDGDAEDFHTSWKCRTRVLEHRGTRLRAAVCLRAYRKLPGLYDLAARAMTFDSRAATVTSSFELYGFSAKNAQALVERYLEGFSWTP